MAEGGWPLATRFAPDDDHPQRALDDVRAVLGRLERHLAVAEPLAAGTAAALIEALEGLTARLSRQEAEAQGQSSELALALAALTSRLEAESGMAARLDAALSELAEARTPRDPGPVRAILVAGAALAALAVTAAGVVLASQPGRLPAIVVEGLRVHRPIAPLRPGLAPIPPAVVAAAGAGTGSPVVSPGPGAESYGAVQAALTRGEATAFARLTGLADAGDPDAQLHLASFYETGRAGLPRDLAMARMWTRRAAGGGNRVAMHNLGLFLTEGDGGPRDVEEAAAWFRRAADRGVVDSQFNLGLLYEAGRGVPRNLREAYRWFAIAANAGDLAAREKQVEIEGRLSVRERADLDRESSAYQPAPVSTPDPGIVVPPATTLAETQVLLSRQGYYVGPVDGQPTPQLKAAAQAYLRDHPQVRP